MNPKQALNLVDQVCAQAPVARAVHIEVQKALAILAKIVNEQAPVAPVKK